MNIFDWLAGFAAVGTVANAWVNVHKRDKVSWTLRRDSQLDQNPNTALVVLNVGNAPAYGVRLTIEIEKGIEFPLGEADRLGPNEKLVLLVDVTRFNNTVDRVRIEWKYGVERRRTHRRWAIGRGMQLSGTHAFTKKGVRIVSPIQRGRVLKP